MVEMAEKSKNREDQEERDLKRFLKFLSLKVKTPNHGEHKFLVFYIYWF